MTLYLLFAALALTTFLPRFLPLALWRKRELPAGATHCHCSRCRKATGTGHASNLFLQPAALRWLSGEEHTRAFKAPPGSTTSRS